MVGRTNLNLQSSFFFFGFRRPNQSLDKAGGEYLLANTCFCQTNIVVHEYGLSFLDVFFVLYSDTFSTTTPATTDIENPGCVKWRETLPAQEESAGIDIPME